jgi:hypothetical protein
VIVGVAEQHREARDTAEAEARGGGDRGAGVELLDGHAARTKTDHAGGDADRDGGMFLCEPAAGDCEQHR